MTHSDPATFTLARARENGAAALFLPGADNVRAASTSMESVASPSPEFEAGGGLAAAFRFPGPFGVPDGRLQQRWRRRFGGADFKDDMGVNQPEPDSTPQNHGTDEVDDKIERLAR